MKTIIVTAAIIEKDLEILIAQRNEGVSQGLKWEFPGGKLEEGEDPEECIIREIKEELDITIAVQDIYKVVMHRYNDKNVLLLAYLCKHTNGQPAPVGCRDLAWVSVEKILDYDLAAADKPIAQKLQKHFKYSTNLFK